MGRVGHVAHRLVVRADERGERLLVSARPAFVDVPDHHRELAQIGRDRAEIGPAVLHRLEALRRRQHGGVDRARDQRSEPRGGRAGEHQVDVLGGIEAVVLRHRAPPQIGDVARPAGHHPLAAQVADRPDGLRRDQAVGADREAVEEDLHLGAGADAADGVDHRRGADSALPAATCCSERALAPAEIMSTLTPSAVKKPFWSATIAGQIDTLTPMMVAVTVGGAVWARDAAGIASRGKANARRRDVAGAAATGRKVDFIGSLLRDGHARGAKPKRRLSDQAISVPPSAAAPVLNLARIRIS